MIPVITELARQVDRRWAATGYDRDAFASLAAEALEDNPPPDFPTVARELAGGLRLPPQRRLDQSFGQPALTLHRDDRFVVEALCWHTGSPGIHQHSFSGAFRVTTGRSVHSRYRFSERERLTPTVALGTLAMVGVEVLDGTSVTPIHRGTALVHSAFHLDNPSMTVVVRTHDEDEPEYTYLPPGVAYDPAVRDESLHKRLQLLDTLHAAAHPSYLGCVTLALESSDLYGGMEVLMRVHGHGLGAPVLAELAAGYERRHGPAVAPVLEAVREQRRRSHLLALRATIRDGDLRYVLACLLSSFDRDSFRRQLARAAPGARDAFAVCLRHVLELSPGADHALGVTGTALLAGVVPGGFPAWLARHTDEPLDDGQVRLLTTFYRQLAEHPLLTPLRTG